MEIVFIILAVPVLILAVGLFISRLKLSRIGIASQGVVRRKVKKLMPGAEEITDKSDHLEVWYLDLKRVEQNSLLAFLHQPEDIVDLVIAPKNYKRVIVKSFIALYSAPLVLFILGLVPMYLALALCRRDVIYTLLHKQMSKSQFG